MLQTLADPEFDGLERSCTPSPGDWVRVGAGAPGLERIEAFFHGHAYGAHRHDSYALGVTLSGVQSFDYRGCRHDSTAGRAIVLHPDEVHNGRSGVEAGFRYRMLYLEPRLVREALGARARSLPFVPAGVSNDPRLIRAIGKALVDLDGSPYGMEVDDIVLELSEAMLAQDPSRCEGRSRGPVSFEAAERARQFLDAHLDRGVQSPELETATGLDRFTLARHFRASFGTSPYNYLVMRRLDRARSMLSAQMRLADIAFACGFADQSHMTRQFRRAYGVPPGRWRDLQRMAAMPAASVAPACRTLPGGA